MSTQRLALALTATNLIILVVILGSRVLPSTAQAAPRVEQPAGSRHAEVVPVLRGGALELFDDSGQVRSRINIESNGEVVLRLLDRNGTIRVKLGANEKGSGLVLLDHATEPGVQIRSGSEADGPSVTLRGTGGQERVIRP